MGEALNRNRTWLLTIVLFIGSFYSLTPSLGQKTLPPAVDYIRDVQPILKAHCFQCHGNTQNQGGFSLNSRELALKGGVSGSVLSPGHSASSLFMTRVLGTDGKPRMPLGFAPLLVSQVKTLSLWIDQGASWPVGNSSKHWAYIKPLRPNLPVVKNHAWVRNPIDTFILAKLEKEHLKPSPPADKVTLLRRVTLDLIGLPPTPKEVDSFLADSSPNAYEKVVTNLLANPHYGERMALPWLDAARYADSNGFQEDGDNAQYIWRDWVVRAFNSNMPFDQFTLLQLAGDLLPNATTDQKIATGFNRCHLLNGEGGAIPEEQRNVILFDRVDVTATNWLGATLACAQCHDHKYDPFTQKDYYSFLAFFNRVPEIGTPQGGNKYRVDEPSIIVPTDDDAAKLKELESEIAAARTKLDTYSSTNQAGIQEELRTWETLHSQISSILPKLEAWSAVGPFPAASFDTAFDTEFDPEKKVDLAKSYNGGKLIWASHPDWIDGKIHPLDSENSAYYLVRTIHTAHAMPLPLSIGSDDGVKVWLNGKLLLANKVTRAAAPDQEKIIVSLTAGENTLLIKIVNGGGIGGFYFNVGESTLPESVQSILKIAASARTAAQLKQIRDYYLSAFPPALLKEDQDKIAKLEKERDAFRTNLPRVMVMSDAMPRKTHILERGNYEMPRAEVEPDVPASLTSLTAGVPKNRLGLAQWLINPDNPLTARVQVNRIWQLFFGTGLVKTSENFGTQSDLPIHPQLLDWLAVDFRENGWDVKRIQRMIVTSATYRQTSKISPEVRVRDPENRLLARAARFRLSSLLLRDAALGSSGLLNEKIGGKPVYPYQPKSIWDGLSVTLARDFTYPQSKGSDLYRRSLYTFWRRTVAPSDMFDASVRNVCKVRLTVTSTPLHALTTLNDVTWVEAARALAEKVMKEAGPNPNSRLAEAFRRVCARRPAPEEMRILHRDLDRAMAAFQADPKAAELFLKSGDSPRDSTLNPVEHAAYASVCLTVYNLDEALTRE